MRLPVFFLLILTLTSASVFWRPWPEIQWQTAEFPAGPQLIESSLLMRSPEWIVRLYRTDSVDARLWAYRDGMEQVTIFGPGTPVEVLEIREPYVRVRVVETAFEVRAEGWTELRRVSLGE